MSISNTAGVRHSLNLTDGSGCVFAASSASARAVEVGVTVWIITAIRMPFSRSTGYLVWQWPMLVKVNLVTSNNRLESRMREIRQSGSVGGEVQINGPSLPLSLESEGHWAQATGTCEFQAISPEGATRANSCRPFGQRREGFIAARFKAFPKSLLPLRGGEGGRRPDEGVRRLVQNSFPETTCPSLRLIRLRNTAGSIWRLSVRTLPSARTKWTW